MKSFHRMVFDDVIEGTTAVYTNPEFNALLAMTDKLEIVGVASQVSGTSPTLTVNVESSPDDRNFITEAASINAANLSTSASTMVGGVSAADHIGSGFVRLKIALGGTSPKARLRLYATGRGEQLL